MENTNTNPIASSVSSLKEEKRTAVAAPKPRIGSKPSLHKEKKPGFHFARKIMAWVSGLFSRKAGNPGSVKSASPAYPKVILLPDVPSAKSAAKTLDAPAAMHTTCTPHDITLKLAEQQFITMDISQSTRN